MRKTPAGRPATRSLGRKASFDFGHGKTRTSISRGDPYFEIRKADLAETTRTRTQENPHFDTTGSPVLRNPEGRPCLNYAYSVIGKPALRYHGETRTSKSTRQTWLELCVWIPLDKVFHERDENALELFFIRPVIPEVVES